MPDFTSAAHSQARERLETDYRAGRRHIEPDRITCALDMRVLHGPEVDEACGAREPAVDHWEAGSAAPTWEQVEKLAALTDMPVEFFFRPPHESATFLGGWFCGPGGCNWHEPRHPVSPYDPNAPIARIYQLPTGGRRG